MRLLELALLSAALPAVRPAALVRGPLPAPRPLGHCRSAAPLALTQSTLADPSGVEFDTLADNADIGPVGVLLLSVGAPETTEDVEEYLYNVFCDPEIRTLPPLLSWAFKRPLAWFIAKSRTEQAKASMMAVSYTHLTLPTTPYV